MKRIFVVFFLLLISVPGYAADKDQPQQTEPYKLNEVDQPPRVLKSMMPLYPFEARQNGIEGRVVLRFVVDKEGKAQEPQVVSGEPGGVFEQAALDSVFKYKFSPAYKNGEPVDCTVKLPIVFSLDYNYKGGAPNPSPQIPKESKNAIEIAAYYNRDFDYFNKGRFDRAINDLNRAIEINPDDPSGYDSRGFLYSIKGQFDGAINDFSKVIEISPENADGYRNRGIAYYYKGQYDEAISDYTKAIEINPEDAKAYAKRGDAFDEAGNVGKACSDWKKARDLGDTSGWSFKNIQRCAGK